MSDFSTRFGYEAPATDLAESDMPKSLRDGLWDLCRVCFIHDIAERNLTGRITGYGLKFEKLSRSIWFDFFRESSDDRPANPEAAFQLLRRRFNEYPFFKGYEFVEFMAQTSDNRAETDSFIRICNELLARERAAFRFADDILIRIADQSERAEIERSLSQDMSASVRSHIKRAASSIVSCQIRITGTVSRKQYPKAGI